MLSQTKEGKGVAKAAAFIMIMITISRLTGFLREMITAHTFGQGKATDAFFAAFTVPDMMYYLLIGGALSSAFIPVFTSYLAKNQEEEGWEAASTFINVTLILLVLCTIAGIIFAPAIAPLVAYKFHGSQRDLLVDLIRFMFPAVFCTATAGLQMGILNSYRDFVSPTLGPIVYNIGIIMGSLFLGHRYGVYGMATGVVAGALGNVLLQVPFVLKHNRGYKFKIDFNNPGYRKMIRLMIPALIGLSVTQLNLVINQNLASGLSAGSITALRYANRVMQLPLGIFAMGMAQALFPTMSRQAAREEFDDLRRTVELGIRAIIFITLPAAVGLIVLRVPIIQTLFQKGEFTAADTHRTAAALIFYSLGLVAASSIQVLTRVYYSLHDTSTPVKTGLAMVALNFTMNIAFLRFTNLGHRGLALAFAIDGTINMILLVSMLSKRINKLDVKSIVMTFAKGLIAAGLLGLVASLSYQGAGRFITMGLPKLAIAIGSGVATYIAAAYVLRMKELWFCIEILQRRRSKGKA